LKLCPEDTINSYRYNSDFLKESLFLSIKSENTKIKNKFIDIKIILRYVEDSINCIKELNNVYDVLKEYISLKNKFLLSHTNMGSVSITITLKHNLFNEISKMIMYYSGRFDKIIYYVLKVGSQERIIEKNFFIFMDFLIEMINMKDNKGDPI